MQLLKKLFAVALVALWSLSVNHCKLEQLTGFQFLKCVEAASAATCPADDCQTPGCASVESGSYKSEDNHSAASAAPQTPAAGILQETIRPVASRHLVFLTPPPQWLKTWQFACRAALPVRAPSFVS